MKASHRIAGIVATVVSSILLIVLTFAYDWFPVQASTAADDIDTLYKLLVAFSIPFFVIIVALIAFSVVEFRAKPSDPLDKDGAPLHGSTKLELVWTAIPLIVVIAIGIYSWIVLDNVEAKKPNEMKIRAIGQQFAWKFEYLADGREKMDVKTSGDLVVPIGKPLTFEIVADDVMHSFWIPAVRLKRDATPGFVSPLRFTPNRVGEYPIVCAELCGVGHATMRSQLRVVSDADFKKWLLEQKGGSAKPGGNKKAGEELDGEAIFTSAGCGGCHVFSAVPGAAGTAGPKLDGLALSDAAALEAIVDPDATIAKGYSKGIMPASFKDSLSQEELDALAKFLAENTK